MHRKIAGALAGLVAAGAIVMGLLGIASSDEGRMTSALFDHHSVGVVEKPVRSELFDHHSAEL